MLRAVENAALKFQREDELAKAIKAAEDKWMPLHSNESATMHSLLEERRRDQASHFILRLAFCSAVDSLRWFVTQECLLFRIRFSTELSRERVEFLRRTNSHLVSIDGETKAALLEDLRRCSPPGREADDFFRVPFEYVPDLVGRRTVLVRGGWAYVPKSESFAIILSRFKDNLEHWMERTARELPSLRDDRLLPILHLVKASDTSATDQTRGFVEGKLCADDLDAVQSPDHYCSPLPRLIPPSVRQASTFHPACSSSISAVGRKTISSMGAVSSWASFSRYHHSQPDISI